MEQEKEMTFLDHLEQLRWHLIRSASSVLIFSIIAFISKDFVFGKLILGPSKVDFWSYQILCELLSWVGKPELCITDLNFTIQSRQLTGQFTMHILSSFVLGLIAAFPYVFWELWRFIKPGLYPNERKSSRGAVFFVALLFISGVLFGYYIISPLSINFLASYTLDDSIVNQFDIISYVNTLTMLVLACGIMFQLPMVVYFLSKAGILSPQLMKAYRKHSMVVNLVLSAILTPPDVISQILVSIPLIILYEISIMVSAFVQKGKLKNKQ